MQSSHFKFLSFRFKSVQLIVVVCCLIVILLDILTINADAMPKSNKDSPLPKSVNLKLVVFDLDYTLWPMWIDSHATPPFRKTGKGEILDAHGSKLKAYPEVTQVLKELLDLGYDLGIASRTGAVEEAYDLVKLLEWSDLFKYKEIYPGQKTNHFSKFKKDSGLDHSQMLFFDDEARNIRDLEKVGVVSIFVNKGVGREIVREGVERFIRERDICEK